MKELTRILAENLKKNEEKLRNYYEDDTDIRPEDHPDIEQIRTNIMNLSYMIIKLETGITDKIEAEEWLLRNDINDLIK